MLGRMNTERRPSFIVSTDAVAETANRYPKSDETCGHRRHLGRAAGLVHLAVNVVRLPPGQRSSWPHAEETEEEFVYVLEGEVDAWIDGDLHRMKPGDFAALPAGTGVCHTFINNGERDARLIVGGHADRADNRIYYPLHPQRRKDLPASYWWDDFPERPLGPHDGLPDALRRTV